MAASSEQRRRRMVERQIQRRGIDDPRILEAFFKVPRHRFVPQSMRAEAYEDGPLPIGEGQTISQPFMVAAMVDAARVDPADRVLEIGTGSGYQTAILAELAAHVYSIERIERLAGRARKKLKTLGCGNVSIRVGDGTLGWAEEAPFDAIVVSAGSPDVPQPLVDQLAMGGRLVIPVQGGVSQILNVLTRTETGVQRQSREACSFVPLIGRFGWPSKK